MFPASSSDDEHDILQHPAAQCRDRSPNEALEKADASHAKHEPEARGNASAQPRQGIQRPRPLPPLPPQRWESRDAILHASVAESSQRESFKDLLRTIQKQENIEARLFCWERLYDETPVYCSQAYMQEDTGKLFYVPEVGKIMASKLRWGMCLYLKAGFREDLPRYHLVHGTLTSPLVPMENQQGPIVRKAIAETMSWSTEEASMLKVFKRHIETQLFLTSRHSQPETTPQGFNITFLLLQN